MENFHLVWKETSFSYLMAGRHELTDELLDALQDDPAQEIALLCSLLNNPDISAEEKEMLCKKIAGDGTNQKLVATLHDSNIYR